MINSEALTVVLQVPGINALTLEKTLNDAGLQGSDIYSPLIEKKIDLAAVKILQSLIVQNEAEGGFSYAISQPALERRIFLLLAKWGIDEPVLNIIPKVRTANRW